MVVGYAFMWVVVGGVGSVGWMNGGGWNKMGGIRWVS